MKREQQDKLTEYFLRENHIDTSIEYEVSVIPARELICEDRFDIGAKLIYIDAREKGVDMTFATNVYYDSINAFSNGSFTEPGTEEKNSFDKYVRCFDKIIDDIKTNGFDDNKSLIPVGDNNVICDGAHRVAAAAYFDKSVTIIRFPQLKKKYDYAFFRKRLMREDYMGYIATNFTALKNNLYFACLWPSAGRDKLDMVKELIGDIGEIYFEQDVYLTYNGMCNFMAQIYGHQSWTGTIENQFSGVKGKATACYNKRYPVHTYLFSAANLEEVVKLKGRIRALFDLENHSIHVSDDMYETRMMTNLLYNPNSVYFLNNTNPFKYSYVFNKMSELKKAIELNKLDLNRFIIDSSSVLETCGLRQARDVDYLTDYIYESYFNLENITSTDEHSSQLQFHSIGIKDMLYIPENYYYFNGMKFISIERLIEMKQRRNEPKDRKDVRLLKSLDNHFNEVPKAYRQETVRKMNSVLKRYRMYGHGGMDYRTFCKWYFKIKMKVITKPFRKVV